jgi:hypothetical protein
MLRESLYSIDYKDLRIIGISIHYECCSDTLLISDKSINCIKVFDSTLGNNRIIGNMVININKVKFGNYTLDFLNNYNNTGFISVILENLDSDVYECEFISRLYPIDDKGNYSCIFEGKRIN